MNSKNIKKFIKLYDEKRQEQLEKWGIHYPPKDFAEFEAWNERTFEEHLNKEHKTPEIKTKLFVSLLHQEEYFGLLYAFENQDFRLLNNVIFQNSRRQLLESGMSASGADHCDAFFKVLGAFACNDFLVIDSFFPKELPLSQGQYYTENAVNLLKILHYQQFDFQAETIKKAQKFLIKKITLWEKCVVEYFLAIVEKNPKKLSEILQELCLAYQKMSHSVSAMDNKMRKCFAMEIHGLYRFVKHIDNNLFDQITMPSHDSFFVDFEMWQKENQYPKGELFYLYPPKMDYMNQIFRAEIPKMTLHNPYNDKRNLKNVEKFAEDLTEAVNR